METNPFPTVKPYPLQLQSLQTVAGYYDMWATIVHNDKCSYKDAWEKLEDIYYIFFGQHKYGDYQTFCEIKKRHLKKLLLHRSYKKKA